MLFTIDVPAAEDNPLPSLLAPRGNQHIFTQCIFYLIIVRLSRDFHNFHNIFINIAQPAAAKGKKRTSGGALEGIFRKKGEDKEAKRSIFKKHIDIGGVKCYNYREE